MRTNSNTGITPARVLATLQHRHAGRDNGVTMAQLANEIIGRQADARDQRNIRYAIVDLREQGHPICAQPGRGYYYAVSAGDINETCEFLYSRVSHTLKQIAALKRKAMPDFRGQLNMDV